MRHVPERLLQPLLRILDEYEAGVRAKTKRTQADHIRLYDVSRVRYAINKQYRSSKKKSIYSS